MQDAPASVPEWAGTYFKWWGIYTQGDGVGATGGKGGEGLVSDYFMMRIGIPNGIISSSQLPSIGGITRKYPRPGRYYRPPEYPAALADDRVAAGGRGCARRDWFRPRAPAATWCAT